MTGYGAAAGKVGKGRLYVEIKTINHRYCDITFKIPLRMGSLEGPLKELLQARLQRGRVELFIRELDPVLGTPQLQLDLERAKQYQKIMRKLQKDLKLNGSFNWLSAVGLDHFVRSKEPEGDYLKYWRAIQGVTAKASEQLEKMRQKEGAFILRDQKKRLHLFQSFVTKIQQKNEKQKNDNKQNHGHPVTGLTANGNADKIDITEELVRLQSHARQYESLLAQKGAVGRKLDFLIQEMHREINTVGAKACDSTVSKYIVESKALLENLREQIQNVI